MLAGCPVTELLRRWAEGLRGPPAIGVSCGLKVPNACLGDGGPTTCGRTQNGGLGRVQSRREARVNLGPRARRKEKCSAFGLRLQRLSSKVSLKTPSASRLHWDKWMQGGPQGNPAWETDCPAHLRLAWEKGGTTLAALWKQDRAPEPANKAPAG